MPVSYNNQYVLECPGTLVVISANTFTPIYLAITR